MVEKRNEAEDEDEAVDVFEEALRLLLAHFI